MWFAGEWKHDCVSGKAQNVLRSVDTKMQNLGGPLMVRLSRMAG